MDRIPFSKPYFFEEESAFVLEALRSTWISDGPYVQKLEQEFAAIHASSLAVSVCNGTAALELALLALDLKPGDEVIVPGYTFAAPFNMVKAVGATPVYVDAEPNTWCLDPALVSGLVGPRTRALIAVHVYGNLCDMSLLQEIAREHDLILIEDCAQAIFSSREGRYAGQFGDLACFSFQATKSMTTGEGGMVIANSTQLEPRLRRIRNHGMDAKKRYWHEVPGFNFRLTNIQAAMGLAQLQRREDIIARKRAIHRGYRQRLDGVDGLRLQAVDKAVDPVMWSIPIQVDSRVFGCSRDLVMEKLLEAGIETRSGFYSPSHMPLFGAPSLPVTESLENGILVLPAFSALEDRQVDRICRALLALKR